MIKKIVFVLLLAVTVKSYSQITPDPTLTKKVEKAVAKLKVTDPATSDPVSVDTQLLWNKNKTQAAVIVKAKVLEGWHIYAYVPKTQPYIQYKMVLDLPQGVAPLTEWTKPKPYPYEDNILVFRGDLIFIRYFSVDKQAAGAQITAGLYYQTCDIKQCLRPNTKTKELKL